MYRSTLTISPEAIFDLTTPALILDRPRLEANAARMREKLRSLGVTLRLHVKTSKSIWTGAMARYAK